AAGDSKGVEAVIEALLDPDPRVRTAALAALFRLTGRKDFDPGAPEEERKAAADALREWWRRHTEPDPSWRPNR
ncbi:MAG: hypothetical protein L6R43_20625, partial [Planctomycetes bacterium]|nr:hypothetical protein [Planctomycetota bacterium]